MGSRTFRWRLARRVRVYGLMTARFAYPFTRPVSHEGREYQMPDIGRLTVVVTRRPRLYALLRRQYAQRWAAAQAKQGRAAATVREALAGAR